MRKEFFRDSFAKKTIFKLIRRQPSALCPHCTLLLIHMVALADESGVCNCPQTTLAASINVCKRSIIRSIKILKDTGFIQLIGDSRSLLYTIHPYQINVDKILGGDYE